MSTTPFKAPLLPPSSVKTASPGSSFTSSVSNPTGTPMHVAVGTQTLSGKHCGLSAYQANVPWAHISPHGSFTLQPGARRVVSVHVNGHGPPGPHDLIVNATHIAAPLGHGHFGGTASATVGYQVKVSYPGRVSAHTVVCKAFGPQRHVHKHVALSPIQSTNHIPIGLIAGGAAVILALLIVLFVVLRKQRHSNG